MVRGFGGPGKNSPGSRRSRRPQRHTRRTCPARQPRRTFSGIARHQGRGRQKNGLPLAGDESRSQHTTFQDFRACRGRRQNYRIRTCYEIGHRESARTGAEYRIMPNVFIISAPSGSGKSTLVSRIRRRVPDLEFSISYTTRKPRGAEQNGREYFFITREEFKEMIDKEEF